MENNTKYHNWIKRTLALLHLKEGIAEEVNQKAADLHNKIKQDVSRNCPSAVTSTCQSHCTSKSFKKTNQNTRWTINCASNVCNYWLDELVKIHEHRPCPDVKWVNCDPTLWPRQPWEVAKVFQPIGCATHRNAEDSDIAALLTFMLNCKFFDNRILPNKSTTLKELKEIRNITMHSATLEVEDVDLVASLDKMIALLEDPTHFCLLPACKTAADKIRELKNKPMTMYFNKDDEQTALSQRVTSLRGEVASLTQATNEVRGEIDDIGEQNLDEMERNITSASTDIDELKNKPMTMYFNKDDEQTALSQRVASLRGEVASLTQATNEMRGEIDDIGEQNLDEMNRNITSASTDIDELKKQVNTLKGLDVPQLQNKLPELEDQLIETSRQFCELRTKFEDRKGVLECEMAVAKSVLSQVKERCEQNSETIKNVERKMESKLSSVKQKIGPRLRYAFGKLGQKLADVARSIKEGMESRIPSMSLSEGQRAPNQGQAANQRPPQGHEVNYTSSMRSGMQRRELNVGSGSSPRPTPIDRSASACTLIVSESESSLEDLARGGADEARFGGGDLSMPAGPPGNMYQTQGHGNSENVCMSGVATVNPEPVFPRPPVPNNPPAQHPANVGARPPLYGEANYFPGSGMQRRELNVGSGSSPRPTPIDRSASACTLIVSESESSLEDLARGGADLVPPALLGQVCDEVKHQFNELGFELGFSNDDIEEYNDRYRDSLERTKKMLREWQERKVDKRQIGPELRYAFGKLGQKMADAAIKEWMESRYPSMSLSEGQRALNQGQAANQRPPPGHEVNYTSSMIRETQPWRSEPGAIDPGTQDENMLQIVNQMRNITISGQLTPQQMVRQYRQILAPMTQMDPQVQMQGNQPTAPQPVGPAAPVPTAREPRPASMEPERDAMPSTLPEYRMDRRPRGWCVIINNRDFTVQRDDEDAKELPKRTGTDKDAESLQHVFEKLGFIVNRRDNQSDSEMMRFLVDIAHNVDHSRFDCLVVCILTHGVENYVYGSNGRYIAIKDITGTFQANRCPNLAGKPKLFFIEACQGGNKMEGKEVDRDAGDIERDSVPSGDEPRQQISIQKEMIANEADFLIGYATVPGCVSFRSRNNGSWYIRKLCELLDKFSDRHDLLSILVEVNREVSNANALIDGGIFKQTPAPLVTLRKKLYFRYG